MTSEEIVMQIAKKYEPINMNDLLARSVRRGLFPADANQTVFELLMEGKLNYIDGEDPIVTGEAIHA